MDSYPIPNAINGATMSACRHKAEYAHGSGLPAGSDLSQTAAVIPSSGRPINGPRPGRMRPLPPSAPEVARSIRILTRADPGAVFVLVAAAIVSAIIAVGTCCHGAGRRTVRGSAIDTPANRRARYRATGYRTVSIAPPRNPISPAGNADTPRMNRAAPEMSAASVKASTAIAAATPTRECVIRDEAGADYND